MVERRRRVETCRRKARGACRASRVSWSWSSSPIWSLFWVHLASGQRGLKAGRFG